MRGLEHHLSEMAEMHRTLSGERQPAVGGWLVHTAPQSLFTAGEAPKFLTTQRQGKKSGVLTSICELMMLRAAALCCIAQIASKSTKPRRQWEGKAVLMRKCFYLPSPSPSRNPTSSGSLALRLHAKMKIYLRHHLGFLRSAHSKSTFQKWQELTKWIP